MSGSSVINLFYMNNLAINSRLTTWPAIYENGVKTSALPITTGLRNLQIQIQKDRLNVMIRKSRELIKLCLEQVHFFVMEITELVTAHRTV